MASLLAITSQVYAEEEFSISITGPDNEQEAPVRRAPRPAQPVARPATPAAPVAVTPAAPAQRPAVQGQNTQPNAIPGLIPQSPVDQANLAAQEMRPANLPANFQAQHTVGPRETIWSIAHRYSAPYNDVNEFQAVASIYRNNRDAFNNGDVNQIRRGTTLNIPVAQEMALEQTQTGSDLLSNGTTTLPPLNRSGLYQNATNQGALANNEANNGANNGPIGAVHASSPNLPGSGIQEVPSFVARETLLRDINPTLTFTDQEGMDNPDKEIITDEELAAHNAQLTQESVPTITQSSLDLRAIESLLDKTEHNIQTAQKDIYRRLDDNIQRSAQVAKDTATVTAKEEVSELINNYEQVIAELQQSNSDLRSSLSKINKQVEQIRGFQMETADSVAQLDRRMVDTHSPLTGTGSTSSSFESGPVMWILLVVGVLALLMSIGLFVFKSRMRRQHELANSFDDDSGDFMDEDDLEISSLLAQNPVTEEEPAPKKEKAKSAPAKEVVEDSAPIVDDTPMSGDMGMDDNFDGGFDGDLDTFGSDSPSNNKKSSAPDFHDEIVMPSSAPLNTASNNAAVAGAVAGAALGGAAMGAAMASSHDDEAQQAWDNAASNVSSTIDKSALNAVNDDWANSLDSNENSASQVDLGSDTGFGDTASDSGFGSPDAGGDFGDSSADSGFGSPDAGGSFGDPSADSSFGSPDAGGGFGDSTADSGFGSPDAGGSFGDSSADSGFGSPDAGSGFGDSTADSGFGSDSFGADSSDFSQDSGSFGNDADSFGDSSGGFGDDSGGFGETGGFGDDLGGFSQDSADFSDNSGGFGDDSGFGDAGFGDDSGGFGDDLGGDDAKQFAASMQGAGGNAFPKTNALASQEVIQASANHDDQSNLSPAQNNAGDSFAVSGASNLDDQAFNEQDPSNVSLNTATNNQFGDLNSPAVEGNGLEGLDFGKLADEIDHPDNHAQTNLDQNNQAPASTVVNAGLGRDPQEQGPKDGFAQNSADQLDFNADSGNSSDKGDATFDGEDLSFNADPANNIDFGSLANELDGSDNTQSLDNLDQSAPQTESGNAGDLPEDSLYDSDNSLFGFDSDANADGLSTPEQNSGSESSTTELTDHTQEQVPEQAPATAEDNSFDSLGNDDSDLASGFDSLSGDTSFDSLGSDNSDLASGFDTPSGDTSFDSLGSDDSDLASGFDTPSGDTSFDSLGSDDSDLASGFDTPSGDTSFDSLGSDDSDLASGFDTPELDQSGGMDFGSLANELENPQDTVPTNELDLTAPTEQETAAKQQPEADTAVEPSFDNAEENPFDTLGSDHSDLAAGFDTPSGDTSFDSLGSDDSDLASGFDTPSGDTSFDSLGSDDSDLASGFDTPSGDTSFDSLGSDDSDLASGFDTPSGDTSFDSLGSDNSDLAAGLDTPELDKSGDMDFGSLANELENTQDIVPTNEFDLTAPNEQETAAEQQPEADTAVEPSLDNAEENPFDTLGSDHSDLVSGFDTPELDQSGDMDFGSLANELENPQDTSITDEQALNSPDSSNENTANEGEGDLSAFGFEEPTDQQELDTASANELDLTAPTEQETAAKQQPEVEADTALEPSLESAEESPFDTLGGDNSDLADVLDTPELDHSGDMDFGSLANELESPESSGDQFEVPENSTFTDLSAQEQPEDALPIDAQDAAEVFNTPEDTFSNNDLASKEIPGSESADEQELPALDAGLSNLTANTQPKEDSNFDSLGDEASDLASALGQEPSNQIDNNTVFDEPPSELDELSNTFNLDNEHVADLEKEATPQTATEEAKDLADVLGTSLDDANLKDPSELENNPFESLTTPEQQDLAQDTQKDAKSEEQPESEPQKDVQSDIFASEPESDKDSTALENTEPSHPFSLSDMGSAEYPFIMDDNNDQRSTWDTGPVGEAQGNMADDFARFAQNLDNPEAQNDFKTNFEPSAANENAPIDLIYPDEFGLGKDDENLSALLAEEQGESADVHGFGRLDDDIPSSGDSVDLIMPSGEEMAANGKNNDSIFDLDESNDILDKMDFTNQDHNMFDEMEDTHFSLDPNVPMGHEQASSDTSNLSKQPESDANTTGNNTLEHSEGDSGIETAKQLFDEDGKDIASLMGDDFRGLDHIDDNKHDNIEDESNDIVMPNPEAMEAPHESLTDVDNAMDSLDHMDLNKMSSDALIDDALDTPNANNLEADSQDATPQEPSTTLESATEAPEPIATSEQPQANTSETLETDPSSEDLLTNNDLLAEDPTKEIPQDFQGIDHIDDNHHDNIEDDSNDIVMPNLEALQPPHESLDNVEDAIDSVNHMDLNNMSSDDLINESLDQEQTNNQDNSEQSLADTGNQLPDTSDDMIFPDFDKAQDSGASMLDGVEDALNSIDTMDLGDLSSCPVDFGTEPTAQNTNQPVSSSNDSKLKEAPLPEQDSAPAELINPSTIEEVAPQAEDLADFRGLDSIDENHHDNIDDEANDYIVPTPEEMQSKAPSAIDEQVEGLDKALDNIDLDHISNDDLLEEPVISEPISQSTDSSDTVENAASDKQSETYPERVDTGEETFDLGNANDSQEPSNDTQNEETVAPASDYETELAHEIEEPYLDGSKIEDAQIVSENDQTPDISTNEKSSDNYELGSSDIDFKDLVKDAQTQGLDEVNESPEDEIPSLDDEFSTVEKPEVFEPSDFTSDGGQAIEDSGSFIEEPMSQDTQSSILNEPEMELEPLVGNNFAELYDSNPNEISPDFENQPEESTGTQTEHLTDSPFNSEMELEPLVSNDFADLKGISDSGEHFEEPTDTGLESPIAADQNEPSSFDADSSDGNDSIESTNEEPLSAGTPSEEATSEAESSPFEPEAEPSKSETAEAESSPFEPEAEPSKSETAETDLGPFEPESEPSKSETAEAESSPFEPEAATGEGETGADKIEPELDGTDNSDEPSMWSVPHDEFDISNISGSDLNVGQEVDSAPNISADSTDSTDSADSTSEEQLNLPEENTLEEAGFTTNNFDNDAADNDLANADNLGAEGFGSFEPELDSSNSHDDTLSSGSDSHITSGDMLDMEPPNFEVGNADDALLDSRIDGSDALADMLSDVPADIPEVIVQQSGSKLHAQNATGEHDLSNGANNLPDGLSLDQDTNVDTNQFDFADFDSDDQDEQDENLVSDMMNGEHQGFNLDKEQALADNDRFVEDMVGDDNLDFEGSNLDSFGTQNEEDPFLQNDDFGSFTDLPGFDESTFDDDKSPNGLAFDDDFFNTDSNKN